VLFSCKITHSVITYLDRRGEDLEALYDRCDWPSEFLRDPSSWLEADKMEALLKQIDYEYSRNAQGAQAQGEESLIVSVGHQCKDLRAWGVLDSVLRMVQAPKDLFAQPERFLSYFISPAPPLGEVRRDHESVSFVLPVSDMQFPFVTQYLRAALEALPTYISKPMASVIWDNSRVTISWSEQQTSLFGEAQAADLSLHPELVRNILLNLESSQKQLDELQRNCLAKDREIEELKKRLAEPAPLLPPASDLPAVSAQLLPSGEQLEAHVGEVLHELYRLGDYVARGHQLVTLLIGQGRNTPQIQEAMRRVNWDFVSTQGPLLVKWAVGELQKIQNVMRDTSAQSSDQLGCDSSVLPLESRAQEQLEGRLL
jgi:hypothetical protein